MGMLGITRSPKARSTASAANPDPTPRILPGRVDANLKKTREIPESKGENIPAAKLKELMH